MLTQIEQNIIKVNAVLGSDGLINHYTRWCFEVHTTNITEYYA